MGFFLKEGLVFMKEAGALCGSGRRCAGAGWGMATGLLGGDASASVCCGSCMLGEGMERALVLVCGKSLKNWEGGMICVSV